MKFVLSTSGTRALIIVAVASAILAILSGCSDSDDRQLPPITQAVGVSITSAQNQAAGGRLRLENNTEDVLSNVIISCHRGDDSVKDKLVVDLAPHRPIEIGEAQGWDFEPGDTVGIYDGKGAYQIIGFVISRANDGFLDIEVSPISLQTAALQQDMKELQERFHRNAIIRGIGFWGMILFTLVFLYWLYGYWNWKRAKGQSTGDRTPPTWL